MRGGRAVVSNALSGLHGETLLRASDARAPVRLELQLDQGFPAKPEFVAEGGASRGAPSQAAASSVAWHDAAPGRLAARVAVGGSAARSGGDDGRRDERDLLGVPGRGGRHGFNVSGAAGSV